MAVKKYTCPPQSASGQGTFSDNLVGLQLVDGGGFTQANFEFTTSITEKQNRNFNIGAFSDPISLDSMNIESVTESRVIQSKNFKVYPNFDLSQVTNFTLYGSLVKRISTSISHIINFFPAGLEVNSTLPNYSTAETALNIQFDSVENETTFDVYITSLRNPFDIDYSSNANRNFELLEIEVSRLRNFTANYTKYSLFTNGNEYPVIFYSPSNNTSTTLNFVVKGNPFSGNNISYDTLVIRPNDMYVNKTFNESMDEVEQFLLNRSITPIYTSTFTVPRENEDGTVYLTTQAITFPKNGQWNLDITSAAFDNYLETLNDFAFNLDLYRTNLISRFLTTGAIKEFDTPDQKIEKV
jgi:hypothetical protein